MTSLLLLVLTLDPGAALYKGTDGGWRLRTEQQAAGAGGLSNTELRASPIYVIVDGGSVTLTNPAPSYVNALIDGGSITVANFPATQPVSGTVTATIAFDAGFVSVANFPASQAVTGPLTDAQLRATPVPVSGAVTTGGLTDTQLRAAVVPVSLASTTVTGSVAVTNANLDATLSTRATEATLAKLPVAQGSTTSGQSGPLDQGAVSDAAPTYINGTTRPLSLTALGAQRVSITQHEFVFSSVNSTAAQLASSATFTGGCESVVSQPAFSALAFSDQPGLLTVSSYQDAACTSLNATQAFVNVANAGISRSGSLNANYVKVTYRNMGAVTTKLVVDMAFGDIAPATQLNNVPMSLGEVNGVALSLGQIASAASIPVVISGDQTPINVVAIPAINPFLPRCNPVRRTGCLP